MFNKKEEYCSPDLVSLRSAVCGEIICTSPTTGVDNYTVDTFDWENS